MNIYFNLLDTVWLLLTYLGFWLRLVKKRVLVVQLNFGLLVWHSFGTFLLALLLSDGRLEGLEVLAK